MWMQRKSRGIDGPPCDVVSDVYEEHACAKSLMSIQISFFFDTVSSVSRHGGLVWRRRGSERRWLSHDDLQPFRFEPRGSAEAPEAAARQPSQTRSTLTGIPAEDLHIRLGHTNWCRYGRCLPIKKEIECVCCQEVAASDAKRSEQESLACVTYHSEFEVVCLRKSVLEVAMVAYQEFRARCDPWTNRYVNW